MARKLTLAEINRQIANLQRQAAQIADAEKGEVIGKMKVAIDAPLGLACPGA